MSIKRVSRLSKFFVLAGLSLVLGGLAFLLNKKQEENYSVLLDHGTDIAHADVVAGAPGSGDSSGTGDGNDSGGGDGC